MNSVSLGMRKDVCMQCLVANGLLSEYCSSLHVMRFFNDCHCH